jgi:hypothetical protein
LRGISSFIVNRFSSHHGSKPAEKNIQDMSSKETIVDAPEKSELPSVPPSPSPSLSIIEAGEIDQEAAQEVEKTPSNVVNWDGDRDELNPMNWKAAKKWRILFVVSVMTFITCVPPKIVQSQW